MRNKRREKQKKAHTYHTMPETKDYRRKIHNFILFFYTLTTVSGRTNIQIQTIATFDMKFRELSEITLNFNLLNATTTTTNKEKLFQFFNLTNFSTKHFGHPR